MSDNFSLDFLQTVNNWQGGSSVKLGNKLKALSSGVPAQFRTCELCCFRKILLKKKSVWDLLADDCLPEKISSWTPDLSVAKQFGGGVPAKGQGWQGVVFDFYPSPGDVIINLSKLYKDQSFNEAVEKNKSSIQNFDKGIGRYRNSELEVVLEVPHLSQVNTYALGGYSSDLRTLAEILLQRAATPEELQWFEKNLKAVGAKLGADWVEGDRAERVLRRMAPYIEQLKRIKALQAKQKT